jgi:hypothetical protein
VSVAPRLFFDEDAMNRKVMRALESRGIDVASPLEAGTVGQSDAEQLAYATAEHRLLYSFNVADFFRLHGEWQRAGRHHAGIVVASRQRYSVGEQVRRLGALLFHRLPEQMCDQFMFL